MIIIAQQIYQFLYYYYINLLIFYIILIRVFSDFQFSASRDLHAAVAVKTKRGDSADGLYLNVVKVRSVRRRVELSAYEGRDETDRRRRRRLLRTLRLRRKSASATFQRISSHH